MDGGHDPRREPGGEQLAAPLAHPEFAPEQGLRRRGPQADEDSRPNQADLGEQPRKAGSDLPGARLLVDAPLALLLELEVLDRVGDVDLGPVDPGLGQGAVEQLAGRAPTKGLPCRSSLSLGCSPTSIRSEPPAPSPKTVCVARS